MKTGECRTQAGQSVEVGSHRHSPSREHIKSTGRLQSSAAGLSEGRHPAVSAP